MTIPIGFETTTSGVHASDVLMPVNPSGNPLSEEGLGSDPVVNTTNTPVRIDFPELLAAIQDLRSNPLFDEIMAEIDELRRIRNVPPEVE